MFTGIIEQTGSIVSLSKVRDRYSLCIAIPAMTQTFKEGDSISINGVCLTIVAVKNNQLRFDVSAQTYSTTTFCKAKAHDSVNIERSLLVQARLQGHFVLGHVDGIRKIISLKKGNQPKIVIATTPHDRDRIVEKGSIALDGISLTIGEIGTDAITVYLIPHTLKNSNLKGKKAGDWVNVEFDILGKYVLKRIGNGQERSRVITNDYLKAKGFI